jgi:hypothetical protein
MIPQFLHPWVLLASLVLIPAVFGLLYLGFKAQVMARKSYGREEELVSKFSKPITLRSELLRMLLWCIVAIGILFTWAGPEVSDSPTQVAAGTLQVVAVLDESPSMAAEDNRALMPPGPDGTPPQLVLGPYGRRIDVINRAIVNQVLPAIGGNEFGMATFEGGGKDLIELEDDFVNVGYYFNEGWVDVNQSPGDGSDYGKGLDMALTIFSHNPEPGKQKVIILFTDGEFDGKREELAATIEKIKAQNIKVIVVAVGGEDLLKVPVYDPQTGLSKSWVQMANCSDKDAEGNCQTKMHWDEMTNLAQQFGTEPIHLTADKPLNINWSSTLSASKMQQRTRPVFTFVLVGCLLLVIGLQLRGFRRRFNNRRQSR